MQQEQPKESAWLEWIIYPALLGLGHFVLLMFLSMFFAYRASWVLYPLSVFAVVAEGGLASTRNYRGQDSLQWTIIVVNSLLYGFVVYWLYRRWRRSRRAA